jgi:hypothetical protein
MSDQVVHFELPADDVDRARDFYEQAFGWRFAPLPDLDYTMIRTTESDLEEVSTVPGAINGGMMQRMPGFNGPVITIQVDAIDDALARVERLGGKTMLSRQSVGDMGFTAYFTDTEGNVVGLWENVSSQA